MQTQVSKQMTCRKIRSFWKYAVGLRVIVLALLMWVLEGLNAQSDGALVTFELPSYTGDGCPKGSAPATLSPDASTLSLIFNRFVINETDKVRKHRCAVEIPLSVGPKFDALRFDYRGDVNSSANATARISATYLVGPNPKKLRKFAQIIHYGENAGTAKMEHVSFAIPNQIATGEGKAIINVDIEISAPKPTKGLAANLTLDSLDVVPIGVESQKPKTP